MRPRQQNKKTKIINTDGYANVFLNSGIYGRDPLRSTRVLPYAPKSDNELISLYMGNGLVKRITDITADEMTKSWISGDEKLLTALDEINAEESCANALRWANLFGGSIILMLINDGGGLEEPVKSGKINAVEGLQVYDKREVNLMTDTRETDPQSPEYGKAQLIEIYPSEGTTFRVHKSRVLIFDGDPIPNRERLQRQGWGLPTIETVLNAIENNDEAYRLARMILERVSQSVIKFDGLTSQLATPDGETRIKNRLNLIDLSRSIMNSIAIDGNDDFNLHNITLSGVSDLLDRFGIVISSLTGIPYTILFGRSPAGLNATGQSDLENFYSMVGRLQKRRLKDNLDTLVYYVGLANKVPDNFKFNALWMPSDKEIAETDKLKSETAANYVKMNAISGAEVRPTLEEKYQLDDSLNIGGE